MNTKVATYNKYEEKLRLFRISVILIGTYMLHVGCIDLLNTPVVKKGKIVINGQFNNSPGLRQLSVLLIEDAKGQGTVQSARGTLYKNGQVSTTFLSDTANKLVLPPDYRIEAGEEYFVEISVPDGRTFRSEAQKVEPLSKTDSISFTILEENPDEVDPTLPITLQGIEFFAHLEVPELSEGEKYYRWVVDESHSFVESNKTDTCYIQESIYTNPYALFSNTLPDTETGKVRVPIMKQALDKSFRYQHYINAYLHTLDAKSFEYYQKVQRVIGSSGTIYDEVPGPIEGNLYNVDNPEETVSGWVEFFLADTIRLRLQREQINTNIRRQCDDIPGGGPCPPFPEVPCQCLECEEVLGFETLIPPYYWVD